MERNTPSALRMAIDDALESSSSVVAAFAFEDANVDSLYHAA
jgi:hypothetical protein